MILYTIIGIGVTIVGLAIIILGARWLRKQPDIFGSMDQG